MLVVAVAALVPFANAGAAAVGCRFKEIKDNSIKSKDIKNRTVRCKDLKRGICKKANRGPRGPQGRKDRKVRKGRKVRRARLVRTPLRS